MSHRDQFDEDRRMCGLDDHDDILEAEHQLLTGSNVADRVSVEDYIAMRDRAERAEAQTAKHDAWLMGLVPVAASRRAARRAIERLVAEAIASSRQQPPSARAGERGPTA